MQPALFKFEALNTRPHNKLITDRIVCGISDIGRNCVCMWEGGILRKQCPTFGKVCDSCYTKNMGV